MHQRLGHGIGHINEEWVHAVEINIMRGACGVTRWEGKSNWSFYERCDLGTYGNRVMYVVEWVNWNILWFGHIERKNSEEFVKKVYVNENVVLEERKASCKVEALDEGIHAWKSCWYKRRALTRMQERLDKERWRLLYCDHRLGKHFWRKQGIICKAKLFTHTFPETLALDDSGFVSPSQPSSDYVMPVIRILYNDVICALTLTLTFRRHIILMESYCSQ